MEIVYEMIFPINGVKLLIEVYRLNSIRIVISTQLCLIDIFIGDVVEPLLKIVDLVHPALTVYVLLMPDILIHR